MRTLTHRMQPTARDNGTLIFLCGLLGTCGAACSSPHFDPAAPGVASLSLATPSPARDVHSAQSNLTTSTSGSAPVVLVGAGDIASCSNTHDDDTAALLDGIPGTVFIPGDIAYDNGTNDEFNNCFEPSWGRHKARIKPAPGNHEYNTENASPYYQYFGALAGDPAKGYYSYDAGAWHVVAINSNCDSIGGCGAGSEQEQWLRDDLAKHSNLCTLAYWHHPRFSSGVHGNSANMESIWQALYDNNADLIINGHDHNYERFAPQDPKGNADPARGIREIIVGTGGRDLRPLFNSIENSEVRNFDSFGVIKLTLSDSGYAYEFVPARGSGFHDSGIGTCH